MGKELSQVTIIGKPQPKTWDDFRCGCHSNFFGGYHEPETNRAFHNGMGTVFNLLESEFPPAEQCQAAPKLLEALKAIISTMKLGKVTSRGVDRVKSYDVPKTQIDTAKQAIAEAEEKEG